MNRFLSLMPIAFSAVVAASAPSITVTIRHYPTSATVQRAYVPGTFNNWGPNASGVIAIDSPSRMTWVDSLGCFIKSYTLDIGTAYNYKLHEHLNASGSQWQWLTDPLNPLINTADNNNSILEASPVMLFQFSPADGALVTEQDAHLTVGTFVAAGDSLLASASTISIDGQKVSTLESCFIPELGLVRYPLPALGNGIHSAAVRLVTRGARTVEASVHFSTLTGDLFFMTPSCDSVWAGERIVRWKINRSLDQIKSIAFLQSGKTASFVSPDPDGEYERTVTFGRGVNTFVVSLTDLSGMTQYSDTLRLRYPLPQHPVPSIALARSGEKIKISGTARDPQNKTISYIWSASPLNPAPLPDIAGAATPTLEIQPPETPGDYSFKLIATDADGFSSSAEAFFTILPDSSVQLPASTTVPQWVHDARIYCLFFKAFTASGLIADAIPRLEYIKAMGFSTIWVLPVMDVEGEIDQGSNVGYNIIDFCHIDPVYGSDADFKNFVRSAHELGLRVILDITPNHSSRSHPFSQDVRANRKYSRYYDFYQHALINHDTNGLGQSISSDGIVYYSSFSDALLNWNWSDPEARTFMIEVYKYWLREFDIDGFRFDVWWGPHRRYGVNDFDKPLRLALRTVKSSILLLGETAGTGSGTDDNYADLGGGMDMGYDWNLFGTISAYSSPGAINIRLHNNGYRPGANSYFLRFLENQDEDRVIYRYGGAEKTYPVSTAVFMATGTPLLYAGQEVGMGLFGSSLDARRRGTINWSGLYAATLTSHYQKLAQIRAQFPAFRSQFEDTNGDKMINNSDLAAQQPLDVSMATYSLARPYKDANGLAVMNFTSSIQNLALPLKPEEWMLFSVPRQPEGIYFLNNLYAGASQQVTGAELDTLKLTLPPYGVAIYTIATAEQHLTLPDLNVGVAQHADGRQPEQFRLAGSYPNPFNSSTTIRFCLPKAESIVFEIFNAMGQKVRSIEKVSLPAGEHEVNWDGRDQRGESCSSGVYFLRLQADGKMAMHKMALIR